ncbi:glycosyltransferase family 8 protein [Phaeovulum sp.]|uniref:glycosyltransferase family 8 protein n=1 Tax=Phaeovulum sp. TaxID=2934796 RepID=UPI0039E23B4A
MAITLESQTPATARKAVAFCCDANYLPYALFAAAQITALHPARDFDICICDVEMPEIPRSLAGLHLRACKLTADGLLDGFGTDARRTMSMYLRLLLPDAFAGAYDRILYLDADIYVQGGDLSALLAVEMGPNPVAAVRDNQQWRTPGRMPAEFKAAGLGVAPYFNSGVMLIDCARWQADAVLNHCIEFGTACKGRLLRHDQTLLNCVLHRHWAELSPVWNWQYSWAARLFEAMQGAHIVHFIGPLKPWNDTDGQYPPRFSRALAGFLAVHFPTLPPIAVGKGLAPNSSRLRRMMVKHLLSGRAMARYLARFPDPLTVQQ